MRLLFPLVGVLLIAGCGGDSMMTCDEGPYQAAVRAPRVVAPEGLDNLDPLDEVPLPEASPREEDDSKYCALKGQLKKEFYGTIVIKNICTHHL